MSLFIYLFIYFIYKNIGLFRLLENIQLFFSCTLAGNTLQLEDFSKCCFLFVKKLFNMFGPLGVLIVLLWCSGTVNLFSSLLSLGVKHCHNRLVGGPICSNNFHSDHHLICHLLCVKYFVCCPST